MGVAGVEYDASAGIMQTALRFKSTIFPMVLEGSEFWILLIFNLIVTFTRHMGIFTPEVYHIDLPWGLTGVTGSLMTFFVCFYNSHVFKRYQKLYHLTKHMGEACLEIVSILRTQVHNRPARRKIAKLVMSSCLMFFFERTENQEAETGNVSNREYGQLKQLELLGDIEIDHLKKHCNKLQEDALPSFLVLQWSMELMRLETEDPTGRDDMLCGFYSRIYKVRKCQAEVVQTLNWPMPFQYFHIMNLMLALNLVLWAYSLGCQDSYFAPVIYMFVQMMFQGIRELSTALSDPFGDDEVDFPVNDWMMTLYSRVYGLLEDPYDITSCDLDSISPMMPPSKAKELIKMYVELEDTGSQANSPTKENGYKAVPGDEEDDEEYYDDEADQLLSGEE